MKILPDVRIEFNDADDAKITRYLTAMRDGKPIAHKGFQYHVIKVVPSRRHDGFARAEVTLRPTGRRA